MEKNSIVFGRINQPDSEFNTEYDSRMAPNPNNSKAVLWENVQKIMLAEYGKDNLWAFCKKVGIGPGTGQRIKEQETSVGMDVIEKIAIAFELQPWHLLVPNLDPRNPPVLLVSDVEQKFYASMKESAKAFADIHKRAPDNPLARELWIEGITEERRKVPRD
jgi:hypothetical protein